MLYYSIAHYYDRQGSRNEIKYDNIKKHIIAFLTLKKKKKSLFLLVL